MLAWIPQRAAQGPRSRPATRAAAERAARRLPRTRSRCSTRPTPAASSMRVCPTGAIAVDAARAADARSRPLHPVRRLRRAPPPTLRVRRALRDRRRARAQALIDPARRRSRRMAPRAARHARRAGAGAAALDPRAPHRHRLRRRRGVGDPGAVEPLLRHPAPRLLPDLLAAPRRHPDRHRRRDRADARAAGAAPGR